MPIWLPSTEGHIVTGIEAFIENTSKKDAFQIEFPSASWASASIHCVFADSKPIAGSFTTHMQGHDALTTVNVTNYYNGPAAFGDNFAWVAGTTSIQKLQIGSAGGATDVIQIYCTIVCSSRSGSNQANPIVTQLQ